jgi:2-polyprenyl-3-methyl-5-hydroxy-6-metoxy-1,4-benzoquinol methylase
MHRTQCAICEFREFKEILFLEHFPVYMGTTSKHITEDRFEDQLWIECNRCGCLQLKNLVPLSLVYQDNHHDQPIGALWENHHLAFADFIKSKTRNDRLFLEIGGAHGYLAEVLLKENEDIEYCMIEPSPTRIPKRVMLVRGFVENNLDLVSKKEVIIHSHVLEHLYEPRRTFLSIAQAMSINSKMFISIPNIPQLIELRGTNSLNFEHTYLLTRGVVEYFAKSSGLRVSEIREYEQHSIFLCLEKIHSLDSAPNSSTLALYPYSDKFKEMWLDLRNFVKEVNEDLKISRGSNFLFGAHIFSQGLLMLGLDPKSFRGILDNSQYKQGKRLYGTDLKVLSPNILQGMTFPTVILVSSHYQDEIRKQILEINSSTRILEM